LRKLIATIIIHDLISMYSCNSFYHNFFPRLTVFFSFFDCTTLFLAYIKFQLLTYIKLTNWFFFLACPIRWNFLSNYLLSLVKMWCEHSIKFLLRKPQLRKYTIILERDSYMKFFTCLSTKIIFLFLEGWYQFQPLVLMPKGIGLKG